MLYNLDIPNIQDTLDIQNTMYLILMVLGEMGQDMVAVIILDITIMQIP
uniref:Uncharacterized protein n=1 Tax=Candidatus Kentrum sp. TUN TaxID=2126343 RepID=A0A450ZDY1_9GAMM|nr:MAG: hypothetical protein BECKTUN1418E_GA0071001_100435 [Candidatus Kentron sp. TUN]VFK51016.1 MAG: hypothetical protein BECKTUN1418D_GA0071000_100426 [Candidatus Kentron sp. TUN]VFK51995.1 MAG: hypothetical protein BECKTUN1418F_GA0071002_100435 [Candidatus Kentron sp. TUN]